MRRFDPDIDRILPDILAQLADMEQAGAAGMRAAFARGTGWAGPGTPGSATCGLPDSDE